MRPKIVMKFGGTSLATPASWKAVLSIIQSRQALQPVIVVSAVGSTKNRPKVTDLLQTLVEKGQGMEELQRIHSDLLEQLKLPTDCLDDLWSGLRQQLSLDVPQKERLDRVMGWGERLSARIMAEALGGQALTPEELNLISDDRFQDASILESSLEGIAQRIFAIQKTPVVPGYIGVTQDGRPTTLGRGGSDYTAAVLGAALKREVEIWTDVDGVAITNPNYLPKAFREMGHPHSIAQLSHEEAYQMAAFGSKVLYQKCLAAAQMASRKGRHLRLTVKNTFNPDHPGTVMMGHRSPAGVPKGITALEGVPLLTIYLDREDDYRPLWSQVEALPGVRLLMASYSSGRASFVFDRLTPELTQLESQFPDSHLSKDQVLLKVVGDAIGENHQVLAAIHQSIQWLPLDDDSVAPVHKSPQLLTDSTFEVVVRKRHFSALLIQLYRQLFSGNQLYCGVLGLGSVGGGLLEYAATLQDKVKAGTQWVFPVAAVRDTSKPRAHFQGRLVDRPELVVEDPRVDVVVELMGGLEPARSLILESLRRGKHVVTANKAVLAEHGPELFAAARRHHRVLAFEASVCGEIPVLDVVRHMPSQDDVQAVLAIANGTSNYILTHMAAGGDYAQVLKAAQDAGFAEADPDFDVSGKDAAQKLALLSGLIFHRWVNWKEIHRQGLERLEPVDFASAQRFGCAIRPLSVCSRQSEGELQLWVSPALVPLEHPLAGVQRETNAVALQLAGRDEPFTMVGKGAGPLPTARSVARDLGQLGKGQYSQLPELAAAQCSAEWTGEWYLRCSVADQAGVFAQVALALSEQGLSIAEATQQMSQQGRAHIVLVLQKSPRTQVEAALAAISSHPWCQGLLCLPRL